MEEFDYVIAGAGSAGCVLAYRLAEKGHSVCVLEAGPPDTNPYIRIPAGFMKTYTNPSLIWQFTHTGTPNTYDRDFPFIQGKVLGGTSALNGTIYSRGQAWDYDNWAALGAAGWDYRSVLPYFRRNERFMGGGDDAYRGRDGLMPVDTIRRRSAVGRSFMDAAAETGVARIDDYNGRTQSGTCWAQATVHKGKRWSAAHAYLHPARKRFGVKVETHALVRRIVIESGRARGFEYSTGAGGPVRQVRARACTIVSTGTINTPRMLQLSGIGPGERLRQLGIPVAVDLPGVGENLNDHFAARVVTRVKPGVDTVNTRGRGLALAGEILKYFLGSPDSILGMSVVTSYAFAAVDPASPVNDYTLTFAPVSFKEGMTRVLDDVPGVTFGAWLMRPESRGYVRLRSTDWNEPPLVQPNYLSTDRDRRTLVAALKHVDRIIRTRAMAPIVAEQIFPPRACTTDDEWLEFIRRFGMTTYHVVGTSRMGAQDDPLAVVDPRLRVRGVDGLRVIDASVMPMVPSGNSNAATYMIAEKGAEMLHADRALH